MLVGESRAEVLRVEVWVSWCRGVAEHTVPDSAALSSPLWPRLCRQPLLFLLHTILFHSPPPTPTPSPLLTTTMSLSI